MSQLQIVYGHRPDYGAYNAWLYFQLIKLLLKRNPKNIVCHECTEFRPGRDM
jgi:hypothetical protein